MRDSRAGEALWSEWTGKPYFKDEEKIIFFTEEHIDLDIQVIKRALASALQRDGIADSLGACYKLIDTIDTMTTHEYVGHVTGDPELSVCDEHGETDLGELVNGVTQATFVEMSIK